MCFKPRGEPHAEYQGCYLVPIVAEALAVPIAARLDRISEFVRCGPVDFDTLVLHTGSGDIAPLSTYFNRHLTKLDELNHLFYGHADDAVAHSQGLGLNEQELEMRSILVRVQQELVKASVQNRSRQQATSTKEQTQAPPMTKEGEEGQAKDSSAEKEQGEQEVQEQVKLQVMEEKQVMEKEQEQEVEEDVEVLSENCNAVMTKIGEQSSEESQTEEKEKPEADVKKGEADEEKEEGEDLVELEHLMRANFLMVADEVQRE